MSRPIPDHRIARALERYGLTITRNDVEEIEGLILSGGATLLRRSAGGDTYALNWRGNLILPILGDGSFGVVIKTFAPLESFISRAKREHREANYQKGKKPTPWARRAQMRRRQEKRARL